MKHHVHLDQRNYFSSRTLRLCSHFADTCRSEIIFVADRLRVHTALMLSPTQIETKELSKAISVFISQGKRGSGKSKIYPVEVLNLFAVILVILDIVNI